jgi:hypothetical protein
MIYMFDAQRSDPTENDSVEGLRPNARGPGLVTFGVSINMLLSPLLSFWFPWFINYALNVHCHHSLIELWSSATTMTCS